LGRVEKMEEGIDGKETGEERREEREEGRVGDWEGSGRMIPGL